MSTKQPRYKSWFNYHQQNWHFWCKKTKKIADEFNKIFTNIATDLANKIPNASKRFDSYITNVNTNIDSQPLSINELKDAFFSLKINKSPGHDRVSFNVIKKCFGELCKPSKHFFNLLVVKEIFPDVDYLKIGLL